MKKVLQKHIQRTGVFNSQSRKRASKSPEERIDQLETSVFRLFGFLLGMIATHILIHAL